MIKFIPDGKTWVVNVLLTASLAITVAVGLLIVPQQCWDTRFFISLGMMLLAELQLFLLPRLLPRTTNATLPWRASQVWMSTAYMVAALAMGAVALLDISLHQLIALHALLFFGLVFGIGTTSLASGHAQATKVEFVQRQVKFLDWRERFGGVCDRVQLLDAAEWEPLKKAFEKMRDDLRYVDRESLPGAESAEAEVGHCFDDLDRKVETLESAVAGKNPDVAALGAELEKSLQLLRLTLRRRDEKLRALR
jgi:hypothetical protein